MGITTSVFLEKRKENSMLCIKKVPLRSKVLTSLFCNKNMAWTNFSLLFSIQTLPTNDYTINDHI